MRASSRRRRPRLGEANAWRSCWLWLSVGGLGAAAAGAATCPDSFALVARGPLVVQQPPAHTLLVVVPVRRSCCSERCEHVARAAYFTATSLSSATQPARPGVDFVETRGVVSFGAGQQEAHFAVEVLAAAEAQENEPGRNSMLNVQRSFRVVVQATDTAISAMEIVVAPAGLPGEPRGDAGSTAGVYTLWLCVVTLALLVALAVCSVRRGALRLKLPRRPRAFEYKVLLLPRKRSGSSRAARDALSDSSGGQGGGRRKARRGSVSKNWRAAAERRRQDLDQLAKQVCPEEDDEGEALREAEEVGDHGDHGDHEDRGDSEDEKELRTHLAQIQTANGRREPYR